MNKQPNHESYMKKALSMAELAYENDEVPVGAVLVCDGKVITKTHNQTELLHDATAHAEILAISAGCAHFNSKYLKDCILYVSLEPCPMCAAALYWTQIKMIVWAAKDEKRGCSIYKPSLLHPSTEIVSGLYEAESSALLKSFFRKKRD